MPHLSPADSHQLTGETDHLWATPTETGHLAMDSLAGVQRREVCSADTCLQTPQDPKSVELMASLTLMPAASKPFPRLVRSLNPEHVRWMTSRTAGRNFRNPWQMMGYSTTYVVSHGSSGMLSHKMAHSYRNSALDRDAHVRCWCGEAAWVHGESPGDVAAYSQTRYVPGRPVNVLKE